MSTWNMPPGVTTGDIPGQDATCPTCGSDCNERDELIKAEREIERQRSVISTVNAKFDHLGIRLGEVIRERDALRAELLREHADHHDAVLDVNAIVAAERERWAAYLEHSVYFVMRLPEEPQFDGDDRPTQRRTALGIADALRRNQGPNEKVRR